MCGMKEVRVISDDQNSNECLKQLNQEIALLSELSHPNIVQYYGSKLGVDNLSVYLEFVSGGSFHKLLSEYGPFSETLIQNYTKQILSGLAYLHGRKTMHRDIKGANILVGPNREIELADFGMARHVRKCLLDGTRGTLSCHVFFLYVHNLNIFPHPSLGCTILEMATSKPPWSQYEGVAAIFKIAQSKNSPEIPSHPSEDAQSFVKLCLQRDPSVRPTASQLLPPPLHRKLKTGKIASSDFVDNPFPCLTWRYPPPANDAVKSMPTAVHHEVQAQWPFLRWYLHIC
ncbi:hypothetical protein H0E87_004275 [Populus deltoides]|uniref:Protein kinase domain-containing protein n=1 Tax=Populus deltoides TaxID=3696 RepID=A0A8T2ZEJ6_POPDE|nr:hypothetical protein H0E87_004275 [Populus deltoides]